MRSGFIEARGFGLENPGFTHHASGARGRRFESCRTYCLNFQSGFPSAFRLNLRLHEEQGVPADHRPATTSSNRTGVCALAER